MVKILDGNVVRDKIAEDLKVEIAKLRSKPKLAIIQIGDLSESNTYIEQKIRFGERIGTLVKLEKLPENIKLDEVIGHINLFNPDPTFNGIIVQLPIPNKLDKDKIIEAINPQKDVDGQTSRNIKLLFEGNQSAIVPATTKGVLTLLEHYQIPISAQHVVIVGRSSLVGKPTALAFLNRDATVTICHSKTKDLASVTKSADILVVAAGKAKLITKEHVTKDQVIVDVGINILESGSDPDQGPTLTKNETKNEVRPRSEAEPSARKLVGDVDFDEVSKIVKAISPVPGGTGPMTVASLFQNLLQAYKLQNA